MPQLPLSPRETELYGWLLQDMRMKEIANQMGCSPKTVDTFAASVYRKKNVGGRISLIIQFYEQRIGEILSDSAENKGDSPETSLDKHYSHMTQFSKGKECGEHNGKE